MIADLQSLQSALGYRFSNQELLIRALTHKSLAAEKRSAGREAADNEQLEFLGDSVLGFAVSAALVEHFPDEPEGRLSVLRAGLVSATHLATVAQDLHLGEYLQLGRGEEKGGGRAKIRLLANAVEALIAAIFLDGGIEPAQRFVIGHVAKELETGALLNGQVNYKELLQDRANEMGVPPPRYTVAGSTGPEHDKRFVVEAHLGQELVSRGEGKSKKLAGQSAARALLEHLEAEEQKTPVSEAHSRT
jgi:ribonuclease III